eukprot:1146942-Pelagomonas_calceolata.AAC.4
MLHSLTNAYTHCHGQPQLSSPTQKANPVSREAQASRTRRCPKDNFKPCPHLSSIHNAGPGGNPFYNIAWLAWEEARPTIPELSSPIPNLIFLSDLKDALKSHMHAKHRLGYADRTTTLITKACYLMQIRALAMPSVTCPVSQPE